MKKVKRKQIFRIKKLNLKLSKKIRNSYSLSFHVALPERLSLFQSLHRDGVLTNIWKMQKKYKSHQPCYIDFHRVEALMPDGTIHFLHQLEKTTGLKIKGRTSKRPIVKAMLSKLGIHQKMGLPKFEYKHRFVDRWYWLMGESADFGEEFVTIQNALHDVLGNDDAEFIVSTAISEAVSNVVHHGYKHSDKYKKWLLFVGISDERCDIIISDLGLTIPYTAPKTLSEKIGDTIPFLWTDKSDAEKIEFATTWRKSSTNASHRGKGFDNIIQVQEVRNDTYIHVLSRNGAWSSESGKKSYTNSVDGTIVYWSIPVKKLKAA